MKIKEKYKFYILYCVALFVATAMLSMAVGRAALRLYNYGYYYRSGADFLIIVFIVIMFAAIAVATFFAIKQCKGMDKNEKSETNIKSLIWITGVLLAPALFFLAVLPIVVAI